MLHEMTKLISLLVFLTLICFVRSATLNWSMSQIQNPGTSGNASGDLIYLFITDQSSDFGATTTSRDQIKALIESRGDVSPYVAFSDVSANGTRTGITGYNKGGFKAGDSLSAFVVIFDSGTYEGATHFKITDVKSVSWQSAIGQQTLLFGSVKGIDWIPVSAVPEPATGTLMIISGAALFAGRRRRCD